MLAFHGIVSAYGFWLPNDPRGAWSTWVGSWDLFRHGPASKVNTRHSLAHRRHDRHRRLAAKQALQYPPVHFTGEQALAIAHGFAEACEASGYICHACAILPDHAHLVIAAHAQPPGQVLGHLKQRAASQLLAAGLHPFDGLLTPAARTPSCWARRAWKVFLDREDDVRRAIRYVEQNPVKEGLRRQVWSFVRPYG